MSIKKISFILLIITLFCLLLGYTAGRSYKTYEVALEKLKNPPKEQSVQKRITFDRKINIFNNWKEPKITLKFVKLREGNYNLEINPTSFFFSPESFGGKVSPNTGFATVSLNGNFLTQAYSKTVFIDGANLKDGQNTIEIFLNANDGSFWFSKDGSRPISTSTIFLK